MEYSKTLVKQYQDKANNIYNNVNHRQHIFPDRNEPTKKLSEGEYILKAIFSLKVGFLEDFTILFAYCFCKDKIEAVIKDLEAQGYIQSTQTKAYGKCFILTKNALHYIYTNNDNEVYINEDAFPSPSKLILYKELNGYYARRVFQQMTEDLIAEYSKESKDFRRDYSRSQYIKNYLYQSEKAYSRKAADEFVSSHMESFIQDEEQQKGYKCFVAAFKGNRENNYVDNFFLQFAFLKDYYNQKHKSRDIALQKTYTIFKSHFCNVFRDYSHKFRNDLCSLSMNSPRLQNEYKLYIYSELLRIFTISKRALNNTNTENKTTDELKEITFKLKELDDKIHKYEEAINALSRDYECMVFEKYNISDTAVFKSDTATLEKLKSLNVYIIHSTRQKNGRIKLTFGIFQPNEESMTTTMLFARLEKIFYYYINNLLSFDMEIKIITYNNEEIQTIKGRMVNVINSFRELAQYGVLLPYLDEIEILSTKQHMEERYKTFNLFREKCKAF